MSVTRGSAVTVPPVPPTAGLGGGDVRNDVPAINAASLPPAIVSVPFVISIADDGG